MSALLQPYLYMSNLWLLFSLFRVFHLWYYPQANIEIMGQVITLITQITTYQSCLCVIFFYSGSHNLDSHLLLCLHAIFDCVVTLAQDSRNQFNSRRKIVNSLIKRSGFPLLCWDKNKLKHIRDEASYK